MPDLEERRVVELLAAGLTQAAVAEQLGLSQAKVSRVKRANEKALATVKGDGLSALMGSRDKLAAVFDEIYAEYHEHGRSEHWSALWDAVAELRGEEPYRFGPEESAELFVPDWGDE